MDRATHCCVVVQSGETLARMRGRGVIHSLFHNNCGSLTTGRATACKTATIR